MKKIICFILIIMTAFSLFGSLSVNAATPYMTYTHDKAGYYLPSPNAYEPHLIITSDYLQKNLENGVNPIATQKYLSTWIPLRAINDVFVDDLGDVYIVDKGSTEALGSSRIIALDSDYNIRLIINDFINDMGVPDSLTAPEGVYVTETEILVADTGKSRIVIFDKVGNFKFIISEPSSDVMNPSAQFKPIAVATDSAGRVYVVSSADNWGIISLNRDGSFNQYLGPTKVSYSQWEMFKRIFYTEKQKKATINFVSVEYNNITIDADGFIYATTSAIDPGDQQATIRSKDSRYAPVKRFNPNGRDVMVRNGYFGPHGQVNIGGILSNGESGPSRLVDVALGPDGMWSIIDSRRSRVYTYDSQGNLLFAFGDLGTQKGLIESLAAISYQGTNMLLLDSNAMEITVFRRTPYGDLLSASIRSIENQDYAAALGYYIDIHEANNNYDFVYVGIGDSLLREGDLVQAMQFYKNAYNGAKYSKAYSEYRKIWVEKYVWTVPAVIIAFIILVSRLFKYAAKINKKGQVYREKRSLKEEVMYAFHLIFHPFDGFWDLKHEKRGGIRGALVIMLTTVAVFIYQAIGRGWLFNTSGTGINYLLQVTSILIPLALWAVANWCLTTLFDGEGTLLEIFIASCYSMAPLPLLTLPTIWVANIMVVEEHSILVMINSIAFVWLGLLIFFGMMVTHDYTLGKNFIITLVTILGAAIIIFVCMLFSALIIKIVSFGYNVYAELSFRW